VSRLSRDKGKRGELEWARVLIDGGFKARRGRQYQGGPESPDVVHNIPGFHFEVKRTEALRLYLALEQAIAEAPIGDIPVVAHRANNKPWIVAMPAADFIALVKAATAASQPVKGPAPAVEPSSSEAP
jgi:Holliday junction resolvase